MEEFLTDPASWTTEQWLAVCILAFILLAILVMIHRLLTILKISRQPTYRPNFRRLRKHHHGSADHKPQESKDDE